jgi:hypothetical protein
LRFQLSVDRPGIASCDQWPVSALLIQHNAGPRGLPHARHFANWSGTARTPVRTIGRKSWHLKRLGAVGLALLILLAARTAIADDFADCNASDELLKTDPARAVAACRRLSEHGDIIAEYNLGLMYLAGQGVPLDYSQAARWFRKAASRGDAPAQYNLGHIYQQGQGVKRDAVEAAMWYRKSAEQGYVYAQNALGFMYGAGDGIPANQVEAYLWLSLAAAAGDDDAAAYRDVLETDMAPGLIAKARRMVNAWKPKKVPNSPGY